MLSTGIRTPVGVKVFGTDLAEMERLAREIEAVLRNVPGTSSAYAERVIGGYYLDIVPDRERAGRYGLIVGDVQDVIAMALGCETHHHHVEGRERYSVTCAIPRSAQRSRQPSPAGAGPLPGGGTVPLGRGREGRADARRRPRSAPRTAARGLHLRRHRGPRSRRLCRRRAARVAERGQVAAGYSVAWSGSSNIWSGPRRA
jgi:hypothetical protein